jgi:ATP-dependent DNA helicase RecQ
MDKHEALQQYFGHATFRDGQEEVVDAILQGRDVLGIMPTGAGKSVCYQLSAMLLSGLTIVISPLISLMKDQVDSLLEIGIPAAYLNSSMDAGEYQVTMLQARQGIYRILYVAPERLQTEGFLSFAEQAEISMVTVDEAHCVSQWGQDFRQSYLSIAEFLNKLPKRPIVSAFTATATEQVCKDICRLLQLQDPFQITTGFDRKNLYFAVRTPRNKERELLELLQERRGKSGIVYCLARKTVEELCDRLCEQGFPATRYHAGLSQAERAANQEAFLFDTKPIMIATNAFGMGIDKSNVSFVVHYNMPKDLESYYQEAGRAGRDGEPADCILLYSGRDVQTHLFLLEQSREISDIQDAQQKEQWLTRSKERLRIMAGYATTTNCLREYLLRYFGERAPQCCGHCSNCQGTFETIDITLEAKKIISCVYRGLQHHYHLSRTLAADVLTGSKRAAISEMRLNQLSTYGILKECTARQVVQMIDALLDLHILELQTYRDFQMLQLTPTAAEVIRGNQQVLWRRRKEERKTVFIPKPKPTVEEDVEEALFQRLSALRAKLAEKEHMPAYIVFSNAALRDMCRKKPSSLAAFRQVSGVGIIKSQKYGKAFIKEIAAYTAEKSADK